MTLQKFKWVAKNKMKDYNFFGIFNILLTILGFIFYLNFVNLSFILPVFDKNICIYTDKKIPYE